MSSSTAAQDGQQETTIQPEDHDSTYSEEDDVSALTQSVRSSIFDFKYEHGRRYHAFKEGAYWAPNDEPEQDRLTMQSRAIFLASGSKLHHCPLQEPLRIIDMGCGTGQWVIEVAEMYPTAEVYGTDLSPIQPTWVPPNVTFQIDDVESDWTWPEGYFDLVHEQLLVTGCLADTPKYFTQVLRSLKPGGWCECTNLVAELHSDHVEISPDSPAKKWVDLIAEGARKMGRNMSLHGSDVQAIMNGAGFNDITVIPFKIPIGTWPANSVLKEAGANQLIGFLDGLQSLSLAIFTRVLGWTREEVEVFLMEVRKDFRKKKSFRYLVGWTVYGRKPV